MTCSRCHHHWNWCCRGKNYSYELMPMPFIGCPFEPMQCWQIFFMSLCGIIVGPIVLFFAPFLYIWFGCMYVSCQTDFAALCLCPLALALGAAFGAAAGGLSLGFCILPWMCIMLARMIKSCNRFNKFNILWCVHCCC